MLMKNPIISVLLVFAVTFSGCGAIANSGTVSGAVIIENNDSAEYSIEIVVNDTNGSTINSTSVTIEENSERQLRLIPETGEYHVRAEIEDGDEEAEIARQVDGSAVTVEITDGEIDLSEGR